MKATLGLIIPVYNSEQYICECLDSVIHQSVPFDKVLIIVDGATDKSEELARKYAEKHAYIDIFVQENQGAGAARNYGLSIVDTDYVCFLDSDDYITGSYVETLKKYLDRESVDILFFDADIKDETGLVKKNKYLRSRHAPENVISGRQLLSDYPKAFAESPCLSAYRLKYLAERDIRFATHRQYEDNLFALRTINEADSIKFIRDQLYMRRYREGSVMTSEYNLSKWVVLCETKKECWKYFTEYCRKNTDAFTEWYLVYIMEALGGINALATKVEGEEKQIEKQYCQLQEDCVDDVLELYSYIRGEMSFVTAKAIVRLFLSVPNMDEAFVTRLKSESDILYAAWTVYENMLKEIFAKLPLDKEKKVGIYGTGSHTIRFLEWYERYFEIKSGVYFIDTYQQSDQKMFMGSPVINVKDVKALGINEVIVSSILHEQSMAETLMNTGYTGNVYRFYESEKENLFVPVSAGAFSVLSGIFTRS